MKIAHLTVTRQLSKGQSKQLSFEHDASKKIADLDWTTIVVHDGKITHPYMLRVPIFLRGLFLRNIYGWIVAIQLSRHHDVVMMRHITFDPFAFLFAPFIHNRVSVHHSKEVEELLLIREGWKGRAASLLERWTGRFAVRRTKMILGVTQEIAEYEQQMRAPDKLIGVYPNGFDVDSVKILADERTSNEIHTVFLCETFSSWHGLDKLIKAVDEHPFPAGEPPLTIHLIGKLSNEQITELKATPRRANTFLAHGLMNEREYNSILARCDVGIGSLALERKNLKEASTLKIREMLAVGLSLYSGHEDIALPKDSSFAMVTQQVSIADLSNFAKSTKKLTRSDVRNKSLPRISKIEAMRRVAREFAKFSNNL